MALSVKGIIIAALLLAAGGVGYMLGGRHAATVAAGGPVTVTAPPAGSVRLLYSLDRKRNDKEIIALIDAARSRVLFAMYEFTLKDIADALVRAKARHLDVRGLVDAGESGSSYDAPLIAELTRAGIPIETERHENGNGIMHIKAIVTDQAYALGSYNWTSSATTENDEILEIGTDPTLRQRYENLLARILAKYRENAVVPESGRTYGIADAARHIGEYAHVRGRLFNANTSSSGTVLLDFCADYASCPFSGVIFADDVKGFGDLTRYIGRSVTLTGTISSYRGRAEIKLTDPSQIR